METIKKLVVVLAISFGVAFLDGVFGWGLAESFYVLLGLIMLVSISWLLMLVYKKE